MSFFIIFLHVFSISHRFHHDVQQRFVDFNVREKRYVHVDFSLGGGFAHVVDNVVDFPKDFVQHVMAGMCELTILDRAYSCREELLDSCHIKMWNIYGIGIVYCICIYIYKYSKWVYNTHVLYTVYMTYMTNVYGTCLFLGRMCVLEVSRCLQRSQRALREGLRLDQGAAELS